MCDMLNLKDKAADSRLRRIFGITLVEYNIILADQGGVCKICGHPPRKVRLAVDHDHRFDRMKIAIYKDVDKFYWIADCIPFVMPVGGFLTKLLAKTYVKLKLRRMSIRGLLCMNCNRGLQKFYDKPERFEAAALYLREFERRIKYDENIINNRVGGDSSITSSLNL